MAYTIWSQDKFTKGELSPLMYARTSVQAYYDGLKTARNVITLPQGAVAKRFGTEFQAELDASITDYKEIFFKTFQYSNEVLYQILFRPGAIDIYIEGILVATVTGTGFTKADIRAIDHTVVGTKFRVCTKYLQPKDLVRSNLASNAITAFSGANSTLTLTNALTAGTILPVYFAIGTALPTTTPQIIVDRNYFIKMITTTTFQIYSSTEDAKAGVDFYTIGSAGTGALVYVKNSWALSNITFRNVPTFDFTGGYDALTFTPGAVSGSGKDLTASGAIFSAAYVNGVFVGNQGIARLVTYSSATLMTMDILVPFDGLAPISGKICFLGEPAWSTARGWPSKCSSFQNRAFFANSLSLPNGVWGSTINAFENFDDIQNDDDDAISWLPSSDDVSSVEFIVPYRSLTIHTNSGVYSTPTIYELAITPKNFSLLLQDSTPASNIQPRAIDNQIMIISGNDVHSMLWDGGSNAYNTNIVSIMSDQLISSPVDEAAYVDLTRAGSRYVFITNANGSMAIYQTLTAENVSGWTLCEPYQSYGNAYYRWVASSTDGQCWFIMQREIAEAATPIAISAITFAGSTFTATGIDLNQTRPTAIKFTTSGTLPTTIPQVNTTDYYWAMYDTANTVKVYLNQVDAIAGTNVIGFTNPVVLGSNSNIEVWDVVTKFYLEKLNFNIFTDCAVKYDDTATDTITSVPRFNAQSVQINGDGFGFSAEGNGDEVAIEAHGDAVEVSVYQAGFPIPVTIEPMPLSITGQSVKKTNLMFPKHIREVTFLFNDRIGGTINGVPISTDHFNMTVLGNPPEPSNMPFRLSIMRGWDDFKTNQFTIEHSEPFNLRLIGLFYKVEI